MDELERSRQGLFLTIPCIPAIHGGQMQELGRSRSQSRMFDDTTSSKPFTAARDGFSINAAVGCEARERSKLERVCRYMARPPIAEERLSVDGDGLVVYELKHAFSDGTTHVLFEPVDFIAWPSPPSWLDRAPISSDIMTCSRPRARRVQRPTPSPHRAPAHLAHQHRAKREHERSAHGAHDLDGPAQQGVRYRSECVSEMRRETSCDWRSHGSQDNRPHSRACQTTRAP